MKILLIHYKVCEYNTIIYIENICESFCDYSNRIHTFSLADKMYCMLSIFERKSLNQYMYDCLYIHLY